MDTDHNTPHTNETLNLSVLQRHNPAISQVVSIASYAVIYAFSPVSQTWEKSGIEGTMFVCQLFGHAELNASGSPMFPEQAQEPEAEERYAVFVLNRRGLENFEIELKRAEDVDIEQSFIIVQGPPAAHDDVENESGPGATRGSVAYGLWIFCEPGTSTAASRDINAKVILECASRAEESQKALAQKRRLRQEQLELSTNGQNFAYEAAGGHLDGNSERPRAQQSLLDLFRSGGAGAGAVSRRPQGETGAAWDMPEHGGVRPSAQDYDEFQPAAFGNQGPPLGAFQGQPNVLENLFQRARWNTGNPTG